jgi:hypothetical protein
VVDAGLRQIERGLLSDELTTRLVDVDRGERRNVHEVAAARRRMEVMMNPAVTLYWLPLGAGGHFVRHNGRMFEAVAARREHREPRELYHAALEVELEGDLFTVEMGPAWNVRASDRGVVQTGPVGPSTARSLGAVSV